MVKLRLSNLAASNRTISFKDNLQLGLYRTKGANVWDKLSNKNSINQKIVRGKNLAHIEIPPENERELEGAKKRIRDEFDTTRVRLCFQVRFNLHYIVYKCEYII